MPMRKPTQRLIAEILRRSFRDGMTIRIDLGMSGALLHAQ